MQSEILIVFIIYALSIIGLSLIKFRKSSKGIFNFFLGGRNLNTWLTAISATISARSGVLFLGMTGLFFSIGMSAVWIGIGIVLLEFLLFYYYVKKLRDFSTENDCITLPDFFGAKFQKGKNTIRLIISLLLIFGLVAAISGQLFAAGKIFETSIGITPVNGVLIVASFTMIYLIISGFKASVYTDVFQSVLIIVALIIVPIVAIANVGSVDVIFFGIAEQPQLHEISHQAIAGTEGQLLNPFSISVLFIIAFILLGIVSAGLPHVQIRYMAMSENSNPKLAAFIGLAMNIIIIGGAMIAGIIARAHFHLYDLPDNDPSNAFMTLVHTLLSQENPIVFGVLIVAALSSVMSTVDSQLLIVSSTIVHDLYKKATKSQKVKSDENLVFLSRFVILIITIVSIFLAIWLNESSIKIGIFALICFGGTLGPAMLFSVLWQRTKLSGIIAGVIVGIAMCVGSYFLQIFDYYILNLIPAALTTSLTIVLFSIFDKQEAENPIDLMSVDTPVS